MSRILPNEPDGHPTVIIGNTHSDDLNQCREICDFCGENVIHELLRKLRGNPSGRVYFEKDGEYYRLYGGPNRAQTIPAQFTFHVYIYG